MAPNLIEIPNMFGYDNFIFNEDIETINNEIDALKEVHEIIIYD